jgi:hypothetical protein
MRTSEARVQTAFRFRPSLIAKLKKKAEKEHESLNSYVESILEKHVELEWPQITADFKVPDEVLSLACIKGWQEPTQEELDADPRLAHILGYAR